MGKFAAQVMKSIEKVKMVQGLSAQEIEALLQCFTEETFKADDVLIRQSEKSDKVFFIIEGAVEVTIDLVGGKGEAMIASLGVGESVGEFALVGTARRSATALAKSPQLKVLTAESENLIKLFEKNPHIGYVVFRNLSAVLVDRLINLNMFTRTTLSQYS